MREQDFNTVMEEQFDICRKLLEKKRREYTQDEPDKLIAFKRAAELQGGSPQAALFGMLTKHLVSISDMCQGGEYPTDQWTEKITDSINYLVLLKALICEHEPIIDSYKMTVRYYEEFREVLKAMEKAGVVTNTGGSPMYYQIRSMAFPMRLIVEDSVLHIQIEEDEYEEETYPEISTQEYIRRAAE